MWTLKTFKSSDAMKRWVSRSGHLYQWTQLFINNGYALEYRRLVKPRMPR